MLRIENTRNIVMVQKFGRKVVCGRQGWLRERTKQQRVSAAEDGDGREAFACAFGDQMAQEGTDLGIGSVNQHVVVT